MLTTAFLQFTLSQLLSSTGHATTPLYRSSAVTTCPALSASTTWTLRVARATSCEGLPSARRSPSGTSLSIVTVTSRAAPSSRGHALNCPSASRLMPPSRVSDGVVIGIGNVVLCSASAALGLSQATPIKGAERLIFGRRGWRRLSASISSSRGTEPGWVTSCATLESQRASRGTAPPTSRLTSTTTTRRQSARMCGAFRRSVPNRKCHPAYVSDDRSTGRVFQLERMNLKPNASESLWLPVDSDSELGLGAFEVRTST